jgi:hypothetical protein
LTPGGIIILFENMSEFSVLFEQNIDSFGVNVSDVDDWGDENDVRDDSGGGGGETGPSESDRLFGLSTFLSDAFVGEMLRSGLRQAIDDLSSSLSRGSVEKGRKFGLGRRLVGVSVILMQSVFLFSSFFGHSLTAGDGSASNCLL